MHRLQLLLIGILLARDLIQVAVGAKFGVMFDTVKIGFGREIVTLRFFGESISICIIPVPLIRSRLSDQQTANRIRISLYSLSGVLSTFSIGLLAFCFAKGIQGPEYMIRALRAVIVNACAVGSTSPAPQGLSGSVWVWTGVLAVVLTLLHMIPLPMLDAGKLLMGVFRVPGHLQGRLAGVFGVAIGLAFFAWRVLGANFV